MSVTPIGLYETPDVGMWSRILLVYNDSTYEFITKTDRGRYPREPEIGDRPNWKYNSTDNKITLNSTQDFKPKPNALSIQATGNLTESKKKVWTKFADIDSSGQLKRFKEYNGRIISYNQKGHPTHSEKYIGGQIVEKETFYKFDSVTTVLAAELITKMLNEDKNPYLFYVIYHRQMVDLIARIEKSELLVDGKWTVKYFDEAGIEINK